MLAELLLSEATTWHINHVSLLVPTLRYVGSTSSIESLGTQVVCTPAVTPSQDPIVQDGQHRGMFAYLRLISWCSETMSAPYKQNIHDEEDCYCEKTREEESGKACHAGGCTLTSQPTGSPAKGCGVQAQRQSY